jgi:competence protein ComEC
MNFALARPFTVIGPGIVVGCLLAAGNARSKVWPLLLVLVACALVGLLLHFWRAPPAARLAALLACSIQLGLVVCEAAERRAFLRHESLRPLEGSVSVEGVALSSARTLRGARPPPWVSSDPQTGVGPYMFDMQVEFVDGARWDFRLRAYVQAEACPVTAGDRLRLRGRLRLPPGPTNPGQGDARRLAWSQGTAASLRALGPVALLPGPAAVRLWPRIGLARLRERLQTRIDAACSDKDVAGFVTAILLGPRDGVSDELSDEMRLTGTTHIMAISGQHVALLLPVVWGALHVAGAHYRCRAVLAVLFVAFYALLTGFQAPVVRCLVTTAPLYLAPIIGRRSDPANSLGLAAAAIALWDPMGVKQPSYQLTFAAVVGLMALSPLFAPLLGSGGGRWGRWLRTGMAMGMGAWLATFPLVLIHFNMVSAVGAVATLLIVPPVFTIMVLGILAIVTASPIVGIPAGWAYALMRLLLGGLVDVPGAYDYMPAPALWVWAFTLAGLTAARWSGRLGWVPPAVLVSALAVPRDRPPPQTVRLSMLDVGRGCSVTLQFPDGSVVLYDAGSLDASAPDRRWIAPFLWERGIRRVDAIVLSHPDRDHVNGLAGLLERFPVGSVWVSGPFARDPEGGRIVSFLQRLGIRVGVVRSEPAGPVFLNPWLKLYPPPPWQALDTRRIPSNEASLVAEVTVAGRRVLLMGDAGERLVGLLLNGRLPERAHVLVLPHHGKAYRQHAELAAALEPALGLVPAPVGYASAEVLRTLRRGGTRILQTGAEGAVEVIVGADGVSYRTWAGR